MEKDIVDELRREADLPHGPNLLLRQAANVIIALRTQIENLHEWDRKRQIDIMNLGKEIARLKAAAGHPKDDGPGG